MQNASSRVSQAYPSDKISREVYRSSSGHRRTRGMCNAMAKFQFKHEYVDFIESPGHNRRANIITIAICNP